MMSECLHTILFNGDGLSRRRTLVRPLDLVLTNQYKQQGKLTAKTLTTDSARDSSNHSLVL